MKSEINQCKSSENFEEEKCESGADVSNGVLELL